MHKKTGYLIVALLLVSSLAYAQMARNATYTHEGKTNVANIGIQGLDVSGNPGYVEIVGGDGAVYYLWVDVTGDLRVASYSTISPYASFPTGDWSVTNMPIGTVVGSQS